MQKDLAEFVGAKTTTVSGWTRGISYPRADAMEKIALFFGVPTSRLVGPSESSFIQDNDFPEDKDFKIFVQDSSKLSPEQFRMARSLLRAAFKATNPDLFKGDDDK